MKLSEGVPRYYEWVVQNLAQGSVIGFDPTILTAESIKLRKDYFEKKGFTFLSLDSNPVNEIWTERPQLCRDPVSDTRTNTPGRPAGRSWKVS